MNPVKSELSLVIPFTHLKAVVLCLGCRHFHVIFNSNISVLQAFIDFVPCYFLKLADSPQIFTVPLPQHVVEGNGVSLFCSATGNPQPNITWTKQGSNIVLSSSETLILTNLMRGDSGAVYMCKVQNILGSQEVNATITVLCEYTL